LITNPVRPEGPAGQIVTPEPRGETEPVPSGGDAADDPEVWVHPTDPDKSLILGTDKQGGLHVYGLDGKTLQVAGRGLRPNNVDVLYDFTLDGHKVDLAVASLRAEKSRGFKCWRIDQDTRSLVDVTDGGVIKAFGGGEPYGCCTYSSRKSGKAYVFINAKSGTYEQYELRDAGRGKIGATKVRTLEVGSVAEGCVADHELGWLYVAEEGRGVWKYGAEPDAGDKRVRVVKAGERRLTADVEGVRQGAGVSAGLQPGEQHLQGLRAPGRQRVRADHRPEGGPLRQADRHRRHRRQQPPAGVGIPQRAVRGPGRQGRRPGAAELQALRLGGHRRGLVVD
jgi:myo-inositol-hexaphosphate 3-phosphohydrolase